MFVVKIIWVFLVANSCDSGVFFYFNVERIVWLNLSTSHWVVISTGDDKKDGFMGAGNDFASPK